MPALCAAERLQQAPDEASAEIGERRNDGSKSVNGSSMAGAENPRFIFAEPNHQGTVSLRTGRLNLTVTDVAAPAEGNRLVLQRRLMGRATQAALLGTRWKLNWESRVEREAQFALREDWNGIEIYRATPEASVFRSDLGSRMTFDSGHAIVERTDGGRETYDEFGRLVVRNWPDGTGVTFSYDTAGRLNRVDDGDGHHLQFLFERAGRTVRAAASWGESATYELSDGELGSVTTAGGQSITYRYGGGGWLSGIDHPIFGLLSLDCDDRGRVVSREWMDGTRETWNYDDEHHRVSHIDANGGEVTLQTSADGLREEWTDAEGRVLKTEFDTSGQVVQLVDPGGRESKFTYDDLGRPTRVEDAVNGIVNFKYSGNARQAVSVQKAESEPVHLTSDAQQRITGVYRGKLDGPHWKYGSEGRLTEFTTCDGHSLVFKYDDRGRLSNVITDDQRVSYQYDRTGNLVREVDSSGAATIRTYDAGRRLTSVKDPNGASTRIRYWPNGLRKSVVDPNGAITRYDYDDRTVTVTDPVGRRIAYRYDPEGRIAGITDGAGKRTRFEYDGSGNRVLTVHPSGDTTRRTFDALGRVVSETDPTGRTTRWEYDDSGRVVRVIDSSDRVVAYAYDERGNMTRIDAGSLGTTRMEYDSAGRVTKVSDAADRQTSYEYTACGQLARMVPPDGVPVELAYFQSGRLAEVRRGEVAIAYEYDAGNRLVRETHSSGYELKNRHDANGRRLEMTDNLGGHQVLAYDRSGRLVERQESPGRIYRFLYDLAGNVVRSTDPMQHSTQYRYSAAGELAVVIAPGGATAKYQYDGSGNLTSVRHPRGGESTFSYDADGRVKSVSNPLSDQHEYSIDAAGRTISHTDAKGQTTTFAYNSAGQVIQKRLADGTIVAYSYDSAGRLVLIDDGAYPVRYGYDALGNCNSIEYPAINRKLLFAFDVLGRLKTFTDSEGSKVSYQYDAYDRLSKVLFGTDTEIAFQYDAKGRLLRINYPNGIVGRMSYGANDEVVTSEVRGSDQSIVDARQYYYDASGNVRKVIVGTGSERHYAYDASNQLTMEKIGSESVEYDYLPDGNRSVRSENEQSVVQYRYDAADRLLASGDEGLKYDANGNLIERSSKTGTTRFEYDTEDRLVAVVGPDGSETRYGYAPTGTRAWREDEHGKTYYVSDGQNVVSELNGEFHCTNRYVFGSGIDDPLVLIREEDQFCIHKDAQGNVVRLTDAAGATAVNYDYDSWGNLLNGVIDFPNTRLFAAREFDSATGLYYFRARYYDPKMGRFISVDPAVPVPHAPLSLNRYIYANNNPMRYRDPLGTEPFDYIRGKSPSTAMNILGHELGQLNAHREFLDAPHRLVESRVQPTARDYFGSTGQVNMAKIRVQRRIGQVEQQMARIRPATPPSANGARSGGLLTRLSPGVARPPANDPGITRTSMLNVTRAAPRIPNMRAFPRFSSFQPAGSGSSPSFLGRASGPLIASMGMLDCLQRTRGALRGCAKQMAVSQAVGMAVGTTAATVGNYAGAAVFGTAGAAIGSIAVGYTTAAIGAAYGTVQIGRAVGEGTRMGAAWVEEWKRDRIQRHSSQWLADHAMEDLLPSLRAKVQDLTSSDSRSAEMDAIRASVASARGAAATAKKQYASMDQRILAFYNDHVKNLEAVGAAFRAVDDIAEQAQQDADSVITTLDQLDGRAGSVSSSQQQEALLDEYEQVHARVQSIGDHAKSAAKQDDDARQRIQKEREESAQWPKGLASIGAQKDAIQDKYLPAIRQSGQKLIAANASLARRKSTLEGRLHRLEIAIPAAGEPGYRPEYSSQIRDLLEQLNRVKTFDYSRFVSDYAETTVVLGMEVENHYGQAQALIAGAEVGGMRNNAEAVEKAFVAYQRAMRRWQQSGASRANVRNWQPKSTESPPDFGRGIGSSPVNPGGMTRPTLPNPGSGISGGGGVGTGTSKAPPDFGRGIGTTSTPRQPDRRVTRTPANGPRKPSQPRVGPSSSSAGPSPDEPLYAIYSIHACLPPHVPQNIAAQPLEQIEAWIDRLDESIVVPGTRPESYLAFQLQGEVLQAYRAWQKARAAGLDEQALRLFVPGGRYHMMIGNSMGQVPLFIAFQRVVSGPLPNQYRQASLAIVRGKAIAVISNPLPLTGWDQAGGGWQFQTSEGKNRVTNRVGPIVRDRDRKWDVGTRKAVLRYVKIAMKIGAAFGSAFSGGIE